MEENSLTFQEFVLNIGGKSSFIDTAFGELTSLNCNGLTYGKTNKLIEDIILTKIKPFIASDLHSETFSNSMDMLYKL